MYVEPIVCVSGGSAVTVDLQSELVRLFTEGVQNVPIHIHNNNGRVSISAFDAH